MSSIVHPWRPRAVGFASFRAVPFAILLGALVLGSFPVPAPAATASAPVPSEGDAVIFYPHTGVAVPVRASDFADLDKLPRPGARAGSVVWNFTYLDIVNGTGVGFDGPSGATARATVDAVAAYLSSVLQHTAVVDFRWDFSQTDGSGAFAGAGPTLAGVSAGFHGGDLFERIITGTDPHPSLPDAGGWVDFGYNWNLDHTLPAIFPQYDFFTVILHEMTHALGFMALTNATGASQIGGDVRSKYEEHMETATRDLFLDGGAGQFLGLVTDLTGGDGGVFFMGPITLGTYPTGTQLHAPAVFTFGSSLAHTHSSLSSSPMNATTGAGQNKRQYSDPDLRILADIGYTLVPLLPNEVHDWRLYD